MEFNDIKFKKEVVLTFKAESDFFNKIIDWINKNDIFWLSDLKEYIGPEEGGKDYSKVGRVIDVLKKENLIQCCDVKAGFRQYIAVKKIEHRIVEVSKAVINREDCNLQLPPKGTKVKINKFYIEDDATYYIVWPNCPDDKCILFSGIPSKYFADKIINNFEWEIEKKTMDKLQIKILEETLRATLKHETL